MIFGMSGGLLGREKVKIWFTLTYWITEKVIRPGCRGVSFFLL
jgi:hypothetical protein